MTRSIRVPSTSGQLVWCPGDASLGIGVVVESQGHQVKVRFARLQEDRCYTTRSAEPAVVRYEIAAGERVLDSQGQEKRVRVRLDESHHGLARYLLDDGTEAEENALVPYVRDIGAKERLASLNLVHPELVRARVQGLDLAHTLRRPADAAVLGARVQWLPHQIDVAVRAVGSNPVRLLLADEVGLGKTVEAALIYAGLRREGRANRVLILTPESLCIQWLGELYRKTHELLVLLDTARIEDAKKDFEELSPFEAHQRMVASIDRIARDPVLAAQAAEASWDMVIVDEAHHIRWSAEKGGNPAYQLLQSLALKTKHLLLLTATPMALDPAEYHALLRLLDPVRFDAPESFQTTQTRVALIREAAKGLTHALNHTCALDEPSHRALTEVLMDDEEDTQVLQRFAAMAPSSPDRTRAFEVLMAALKHRHGLADYVVRNRRGPVGGLPKRLPQLFPLEPYPNQAQLMEVGESVMLELAQSAESSEESAAMLGELLRALWATPRALLDVLKPYSPSLVKELTPYVEEVIHAPLDAEGLPTGDARLRWLVSQVRALEPGEKVLVFVESSVAVRALKDALDHVLGGDLAVFHKDLSPRDQDRQVAWFRDPQGPRVMLSTEAGGEGRNFQFCHKVVLYDMPWRPATVEQRIGRIDRVGQTRDVEVLVPYFNEGYEAAVVKVMQEAIGVLESTVGGIDHALEHVSQAVATLILEEAEPKAWKTLFNNTQKLVTEARQRIENGVDPILDHASYKAERVQQVLARVPAEMESQIEHFVMRYASQNKLDVHTKGKHLVAVEGAPGASGSEDMDVGYVGTFSREYALDHEDVEFLSFGHPLLEHALDWARDAHDASASLALCRGFAQEGAGFVWRYALDIPSDVPEVLVYFDETSFMFALDESGKRLRELDAVLSDPNRSFDRMDVSILRKNADRWRKLVESNHTSAEAWVEKQLEKAILEACTKVRKLSALRERDLQRKHTRELLPWKEAKQQPPHTLVQTQEDEKTQLQEETQRLIRGIEKTRPHLVAAVALRLMRAKSVSA
jgi:ATP-dependent helicase HepA